ncbi:uncharacterized protein [Atheta coriaria]|uniref:uncharacterized protein n=1 Tax=Dalotia coriaria TaxID=877792 RepID=UPI0031F43D32
MRLFTSVSLWWFAWLLHLAAGQNSPAPPPGGYYTTRYDHIDIEHILNQKRLVHYYTECLLDRGPCTPQGIEFKRILPEALKNNCLRCTEKQRFVTLKSIKRLKKEYPSVWAELSALWDPTGEYVQRLEDSFNRKNNRSPEVPQTPVTNNQVQSDAINDITASKPSQQVPIFTRFDDDSVKKVQISESLPSPKPQVQTVAKPSPTNLSTTTTTSGRVSEQYQPGNINTIKTTTKRTFSTILQDRISATTTRISYNYDFGVTVRPLHQIPVTGINMVIKGVNTIIQPITDIAGRVITAESFNIRTPAYTMPDIMYACDHVSKYSDGEQLISKYYDGVGIEFNKLERVLLPRTQSRDHFPRWPRLFKYRRDSLRLQDIRMILSWYVVAVCGLLALGECAEYTNKYDNVNVDQILSNNRVLSNYIKCMMDEGPCTPEGRELKKTLPDALAGGCEKCNQKQKDTSERVIRHLIKHRAKDWERLANKYDPQRIYRQRFEKLL